MRAHLPLVTAHLLGNALILWLAYYWLGVGESSVPALLWSLFTAAAIVLLAVLLHGGTFVYLSGGPLRSVLRKLPLLLLAAAVVGALYWLLWLSAGHTARPAFRIASYLTLKLRKPVRPATVLAVFNIALWLVRWMVVPVLALPVIAWLASNYRRVQWKRWYWLQVPLLLVCAFWIPARLWAWVPHPGSFWLEAASFTLRAAAAYLCFVAAWLVLLFLTCSGSPRETQPGTAVSP